MIKASETSVKEFLHDNEGVVDSLRESIRARLIDLLPAAYQDVAERVDFTSIKHLDSMLDVASMLDSASSSAIEIARSMIAFDGEPVHSKLVAVGHQATALPELDAHDRNYETTRGM